MNIIFQEWKDVIKSEYFINELTAEERAELKYEQEAKEKKENTKR